MHSDVLEQVTDSDLTIHVIWLPVLPSDTRDSVEQAKLTVPDSRARHYWDEDLNLGYTFGQIVELPNGGDLAWDVYFVYDRGAHWRSHPGPPDSWWHQLRRDDHRILSTARLREYLESVLAD